MAEGAGFEPACKFNPTHCFRDKPVMTASVPLRINIF